MLNFYLIGNYYLVDSIVRPKAQAGPLFRDPVSVRQKSFNACGKQSPRQPDDEGEAQDRTE